MTQKTLKELLIEQIRDIYDAEKQLVKALPKFAKAADSDDLSDALTDHLEETKQHVVRVEQIFGLMGVAPKGKPCKGMKGLLEEGSEAAEEDDGELRDLAIIAGAQRVEHYEIAAYGTVRTIAESLGLDDVAELLQQTEDEEAAADEKLSEIAMDIYDSASDEEELDEVDEEALRS